MNRPGPGRPHFSVVVPVFESDPAHLMAMLRSVRDQRWTDWECQVVDDGSTDRRPAAIVRSFAAVDGRFRLTVSAANEGIARATNAAIDRSSGEWIVFSDHDDVLHPAALERVARHTALHPDDEVVYTDEAVIDADGEVVVEHRKPEYSPERLLGQNYIAHLVAIRRGLLERIRLDDGRVVDAGFEPCQDNDVVLRATSAASGVGHVAEILYGWRAAGGSIAGSTDRKAGVADAVAAAAVAHLARAGDPGQVEPIEDSPTTVRIVREPPANVSVCGIDVSNGADPSVVAERFAAALTDPSVTHVALTPTPLAAASDGRATDDWTGPLLALCARPGIAAAGPRVVTADGRLVSAGRIHHPVLRDLYQGHPADAHGPWGAFLVARECASVAPWGLVVRADAARRVGGLAGDVGLDTAVAELCTALRVDGYRTVWSPVATLVLPDAVLDAEPHARDTLAQRDADVRCVAGRLPAIADDPFSPVGAFHR